MVATRRASKVQAQGVMQKEGTITKPLSFQMTKNLLRISLFQIAYIRNLFPSHYFTERNISDDLQVKVLNPKCDNSKRLVDWTEKGVCEALYKEYLKSLRFGITRDSKGNDLLEEYVFTFAYEKDGEIRMQILNSIKKAPVNTISTSSIKQLKSQVSKMTRLLVALMTSFDALPDERYIFMHLEYYERTPASYEPPYFEAAASLPNFKIKPFSMALGTCQTKDICVGIKAKSTVISDNEEIHHGHTDEQNGHQPQISQDDFSSLDTTFDILTQSQPDVLRNVGLMVHEFDDAAKWVETRSNQRKNHTDESCLNTTRKLTNLSLTHEDVHCGNMVKEDHSMLKESSQHIQPSQMHGNGYMWDSIPPSQNDLDIKRKKMSRGILSSKSGPSKRIRMQEMD